VTGIVPISGVMMVVFAWLATERGVRKMGSAAGCGGTGCHQVSGSVRCSKWARQHKAKAVRFGGGIWCLHGDLSWWFGSKAVVVVRRGFVGGMVISSWW